MKQTKNKKPLVCFDLLTERGQSSLCGMLCPWKGCGVAARWYIRLIVGTDTPNFKFRKCEDRYRDTWPDFQNNKRKAKVLKGGFNQGCIVNIAAFKRKCMLTAVSYIYLFTQSLKKHCFEVSPLLMQALHATVKLLTQTCQTRHIMRLT